MERAEKTGASSFSVDRDELFSREQKKEKQKGKELELSDLINSHYV